MNYPDTGFFLVWIDDEGNALDDALNDEWINKADFFSARRSVGLRLYQTEHKCPEDAGGFILMPPAVWKEKRMSHVINRKLSERYGPPPSDDE